MLTTAKRIILAFTVFAMFFGAGNLIFPVFLAFQSGNDFPMAFSGFILSSIGLPVLALLASMKAGGLEELAGRVSPIFSRVFTVVVYLAIGPCLAIPRTASTSHEMVALATGMDSGISRFVYCALFFLLAALLARRPERLSSRLGKVLSPLLVILIAVLMAGSLITAGPSLGQGHYTAHPLQRGFLEGYQTMDAIAGLVFASIITLNVKALGVREGMRKECTIASAAGGILILLIYCALALIGLSAHSFMAEASTGAEILSVTASVLFPAIGDKLIAVIFILACFNTCTGLLSSCSQYFSKAFPALSRDMWLFVFSLVSLALANAGLERMISISAPVLEVIYPVAITLMVLAFLPGETAQGITYKMAAASAAVSSLASVAAGMKFLWILPTVLCTLAGILIDKKNSSKAKIH